jgi:hypothetical protein
MPMTAIAKAAERSTVLAVCGPQQIGDFMDARLVAFAVIAALVCLPLGSQAFAQDEDQYGAGVSHGLALDDPAECPQGSSDFNAGCFSGAEDSEDYWAQRQREEEQGDHDPVGTSDGQTRDDRLGAPQTDTNGSTGDDSQ